MAINAKFEADFSSFQSEVNKAVVSLNTFQKSSEDVAKSLGRMVDRYSGEKIIAKGLEINRLFQTTNDLAILTEKELTEVGRTAAEAADKMARMGLAVPDNLKAIASEATKATSQTNDLHGAFQQFDKMLAAVGINIGTEIGAVGELAAAFGQTASQLGLVATAGLAAGTMFASFKLTTLLLELTGLNTQLNKFVDGLAGLPEAAAGAKLDELARAGQNAAHEEVTGRQPELDAASFDHVGDHIGTRGTHGHLDGAREASGAHRGAGVAIHVGGDGVDAERGGPRGHGEVHHDPGLRVPHRVLHLDLHREGEAGPGDGAHSRGRWNCVCRMGPHVES